MKGPVRNELSYFANYFAFGPVSGSTLTNRASAGRTPARSSVPLPHAHVPPYAKCRLGFPTYARARRYPVQGRPSPHSAPMSPCHTTGPAGRARALPHVCPVPLDVAPTGPPPGPRACPTHAPPVPARSRPGTRLHPYRPRSTHPVPDGPARYPSPAPRTGYARAWRHIGSHGHAAFLPHVGSRGHAVPTPRGSLFRRLGAPAAGAVPYEVGGRFPRWVC